LIARFYSCIQPAVLIMLCCAALAFPFSVAACKDCLLSSSSLQEHFSAIIAIFLLTAGFAALRSQD